MKTLNFYNSLIQSLRNMHSKVSLDIVNKRIQKHSQHHERKANTYANNIKSPLLDVINEILDKEHEPSPQNTASHSQTSDRQADHNSHHSSMHSDTSTMSFDDLSNYFKDRNTETEPHAGLEKTLIKSTWEHINAALRHARQGDKHNSKMHADIASSSCSELAHYMSREDYQNLIEEIQKRLQELS